MKLRYSPAARDDLRQLKAYLTTEFGAAVAAKSVAKIVSEIAALKRHRSLARPLSGKIGRDTPYLYLLSFHRDPIRGREPVFRRQDSRRAHGLREDGVLLAMTMYAIKRSDAAQKNYILPFFHPTMQRAAAIAKHVIHHPSFYDEYYTKFSFSRP